MASSLPPTAPSGAIIEEATNPFTSSPYREPTHAADESTNSFSCKIENEHTVIAKRGAPRLPVSLSSLNPEELSSKNVRAVVSPAEWSMNPKATTSFLLQGSQSHRFLAIVQSAETARFSLDIGRHHCDFYYDVETDDITLHNTSSLPLWVAGINMQGRTEAVRVVYWKVHVMRPGPWRLAGEKDYGILADLLLLPRCCVAKIDSGISSAAGMKRLLQPAGSSGAKRARSGNDGNTSLVLLSTPANEAPLEKPRRSRNPFHEMRAGLRLTIGSGSPSKDTADTYSILCLRQIVGSKAAASVFSANHDTLGLVAVKVQNRRGPSKSVNNRDLRDPAQSLVLKLAREWIRERGVLSQLDHPNIVKFRGSDARLLSIYMEDLTIPDLGTMHSEEHLFTGTEDDAWKVLHDIASALSYVEAKGFIHNDIKPANITFDRSRGAVLLDFGLATTHSEPACLGGTPWYIGEEFWRTKIRTTMSDVYALGVTLLYLMKKITLPEIKGRRWDIAKVAQGLPPDPPLALLKEFENMRNWVMKVERVTSQLRRSGIEGHVRSMLECDPQLRPSAKSLCDAKPPERGCKTPERNRI